MGKWRIAAVLAAAMATGVGGCSPVGIEVNPNNSVPVVGREQKVINGITYTKTEYADGAVEYAAYNSPPKNYTGAWTFHPDSRSTIIYVGPKGTRRTVDARGAPLDPLDPRLWEQPQTLSSPEPQPVSAPLAGPTSSTPRPRGEGGGGAGGGGGGGGGGGH